MVSYMNFAPLLLHAAHAEGFDILSIIRDTLVDGIKMLPLLFVAYLVIEIIEHKAMDKLKAAFSSKGAGVVSGALFGLFPQCGFSVAAANLYSEKLISAGALAAVFISTSDEALPVILSVPETAKYFLPLLLIKLLGGIAAGLLLDFAMSRFKKTHAHHDDHEHHGHNHEGHHHGEHTHAHGVHHHCAHCDSNRGIVKNSLTRTASTICFILLTVFVFNTAVALIGEARIEYALEFVSVIQPLIAAFLGLVPSCAVSVILAGLFTEGVISFGALAAGLCAGAGAGMAVLFKSNKELKNSLFILLYIWLFSAALGTVISIIA